MIMGKRHDLVRGLNRHLPFVEIFPFEDFPTQRDVVFGGPVGAQAEVVGQGVVCPCMPPLVFRVHSVVPVVENGALHSDQSVAPRFGPLRALNRTDHSESVLNVLLRDVLVDFYVEAIGILPGFLSVLFIQTRNFPKGGF